MGEFLKQEPGELINRIDLYDFQNYIFIFLIMCSLNFTKLALPLR